MLAAIGVAASRPSARSMAAAASAQASALRDEMTTLAPCSARRSAIATPDAAGGAGDDRDAPGQVKQTGQRFPPGQQDRFSSRPET